MRSAGRLFAISLALAGTLAGSQLASPAGAAASGTVSPDSEVTASQNLLRDGWDQSEPDLSPATVSGGGFGQLFDTKVDGQVYAQPLVVDDATAGTSSVLVATENDKVYSLDGETGAINWSLSLGDPWPSSVTNCGDLTPNIGVTSTPVYDQGTGTLYLTAVVNNPSNEFQPHVALYAINAQTGTVKWQSPIKGAPVNAPTRPFDPLTERQRASLLLLNGSVYMAFSAYCDFSPWVGDVAGVNTTTKAVTLWSDEAGLTDTDGGIWMGGGGLMSDGSGRIFISTGNGVSPAPGKGTPAPAELGDAVVRLAVQPSGTLAAQDFFSPANAPELDAHDLDFGSGGPVGLPFGTTAWPHLLVTEGKDGRIFVLSRGRLGGRKAGQGGSDEVVSMSGPYGGEYGHPAAFAGGSNADYVYYVGDKDNMRALKFNTSNGKLTDVANSASTFAYGSGSPVVTSNGADISTAIVWEVDRPNAKSGSGVLEAFDAQPQGATGTTGTTMKQIWSAPIGTSTKFAVPATDNGRVYVGTNDGAVFGFGSPYTPPISAPTNDFGSVAVGTPATVTVTATAAADVTVTGISVTSSGPGVPFAVTPPTTPVTLAAGQTLSIPVTFTPPSPGGFTGSLTLTTQTPNFTKIIIPLTANGTQAGLYASETSLDFGSVPVGSTGTLQTDIVNGGTSAEQVTAVTDPTAPFGITGLSGITSIPAGGSVSVTVTFTPTAATASTGTLAVTGPDGTATVTLTGSGVAGHGALTPSASGAGFGTVHLGQSASKTVTLTNTGNLGVTISKFTAPAVPFGTPTPIMTGLTINPGYQVSLPVTFTPQSNGAVSGSYEITYGDGHTGTQTLTIPVSGTGVGPASGVAVPSPGGGWTMNGSAQMAGTILQLTPARNGLGGSAVYYQPLASNGLHATFTARLSGGTGADGLTFALLNPAKSTVSSLGGAGGYLGFGGLSGVAVVLATHKDPGDPSGNFIGIATGITNNHLVFAATSTKVPRLRQGTHVIGVTVSGGRINVTVNGVRYLSAAVKLPGSVLAAFTGATGGQNDIHSVSSVSITAPGSGGKLPPPGGGWSYNGSARMAGSGTQLTQAVANQAGSVVYTRPVASNGVHARFNIQIGGGTGGEGMTFALLDPAKWSARGNSGLGLGFAPLKGVGVAFATYQVAEHPSVNFAAIVTGGNPRVFYTQFAEEIGQLRTGTHTVSVTVNGNVLIVDFDGQQVLQHAVSLPSSVMLAYTGSTAGATDLHIVRNAAISAAKFG